MASIQHRDIGDIWTPQASFTVNSAPTDPTTLVTRLQNPAGTITTASYAVASLTTVSSPVAKTTTGTFVYSVSLDMAGHWYARFEGTGTATAAEDHEVIVDPSPFYSNGGVSVRALVSLGETKDWLAEKQIDTSDDGKIIQGINAASERIMAVAGREFKASTTASQRTFSLYGWTKVDVGDLQTVSSASTSATITDFETGATVRTLASTDYDALPYNRKSWQPVTTLKFRSQTASALGSGRLLNITGYWGFPSVPEDIKHATMDAVAYWLDRDVEHFRQDLGAGIGEAGQTVFVGGTAPTVFPLPPESYRIATSYTRKVIC